MTNLTQARHRRRAACLLAGLLTLLAGCANGPAPGDRPAPQAETAAYHAPLEKMVRQGRFLDAALAYSRLASESPSPQREWYALRAAELLREGNYIPQAFQLLAEIQGADLGPGFRIRRHLLTADIALARQMPDKALAALEGLGDQIAEDERPWRRRYHDLRALALEQLDRPLETARERIDLAPLLDDPDRVQANQFAILSALGRLEPQTVERLVAERPHDELRGWLELVAIGRRAVGEDDELIADWRQRYPLHPASETTLGHLLAGRPRLLETPRQVALILPLAPDNRFSRAATAVRDGFLAAWYDARRAVDGDTAALADEASDPVQPPTIRIYDEGSDEADFTRAYQRAADEGADLVIGPLGKAAVGLLARQQTLPVPVLALNYAETGETPPGNLFQLGLSPEQEAREVAERAWLDGHGRAVVITPASRWGDRVARAFNERWLSLGGHVVEVQHYDPKKNDYSLPIRRLLNVDESQARRRLVQRVIGEKVEFIPRRRQDIDFIFMAAFPRQARVIRPQLRFHHAPKVPVYTTSHAFAGVADPQMDRDMDGVIFADMPWTLHPDTDGQRLKAGIAAAWPASVRRYTRLHALGVDAYRVVAQLNALRQDPANRYNGQTGELSLDVANRLQRRLSWARFQRGVPQPLEIQPALTERPAAD